MANFATALSGAQKTTVRTSGYNAQQYLVTCPNTVIFQCQSTANISGSVYAEFAYTAVSGSYSNVKQGMTVLITTSSSDLTTVLWRGRVRKVPTSGTLYINESSQALTTAYYVTVIDDYDIFERLERITETGTQYKDWELTYTNLPPHVGGLQSSYVVSQYGTSSASIAFAPTAYANASGATISTYLWDVGDGTITVGTSSTQNITASFPVGHRWVHLTITDSNSVSNYYVFEVYVINLSNPATYTILGVDGASISASWDEGYNATVTAFDGISTLLDNTRCTIFTREIFGDANTTPIINNIEFVGRIRNESNTTTGDDTYGVLKDTNFTLEGFASQIAKTTSASGLVIPDASPNAWGEIKDVSVLRAIIYILAWHSTALNVMCLDINTNDHVFKNDGFNIQDASLLDSVNTLLVSINARVIFAPDGGAIVERHACYIPTADRTSLTTVMDFTTDDLFDFEVIRDKQQTVGRITVGALSYNTSTDITRDFIAKAPAKAKGTGQEEGVLNYQILESNQTEALDIIELQGRVANHYAYVNPHDRIRVTFLDSYRFIIPTQHQWYTFTIASTDNIRGFSYTTSTRWLCQNVSIDHDNEAGTRVITAEFERETDSTDAMILVALIPQVSTPITAPMPALSGYNSVTFDPNDLLTGNFSGLDLAGNLGMNLDDALDIAQQQPSASCGVYNVFAINGNKATNFNTTLGATYTIEVLGSAQIQGGTSWLRAYNFIDSDGGWTYTINTGVNYAEYSSGNGWKRSGNSLAYGRLVPISPIMTNTITSVSVQYSSQTETLSAGGNVRLGYGTQTATAGTFATIYTAGNTIVNFTNTGSYALSAQGLILSHAKGTLSNTPTFPVGFYVISTTLQGTGTPPAGATTLSSAYGDAAYYNWQSGGTPLAYTSGVYGFMIDGATPTWNEVYNESHKYTTTVTGTGAPFVFSFTTLDTANTTPTFFVVRVCGDSAV